jgi:GTP cyclohydrolase III
MTKYHVATRFLAMPVCNTATAEKLFDALNEVMEEYKITWKNVVGYASDTANVMVGAHHTIRY